MVDNTHLSVYGVQLLSSRFFRWGLPFSFLKAVHVETVERQKAKTGEAHFLCERRRGKKSFSLCQRPQDGKFGEEYSALDYSLRLKTCITSGMRGRFFFLGAKNESHMCTARFPHPFFIPKYPHLETCIENESFSKPNLWNTLLGKKEEHSRIETVWLDGETLVLAFDFQNNNLWHFCYKVLPLYGFLPDIERTLLSCPDAAPIKHVLSLFRGKFSL